MKILIVLLLLTALQRKSFLPIKSSKMAPFIGAPLDSIIDVKTDYRFLVCGNYLIFYKVKHDIISIYRVMNGRRDYFRQLFGTSFAQIDDNEETSEISQN